MKLIACTLPLLAGLPSVLSAQLNISLPRLSRPAVRASLGPLGVVATVSGNRVTVRATPRVTRRTTPARAPRGSTRAKASAAKVLATGQSYLGTRYSYGGDTPAEGFDCSGFVQYVFGRHGVSLPRTSRQQASAGDALPKGDGSLQPGDLMLFSSKGVRVDHVAIYVGNNRILHSTAGARGVVYDDLSSPRGKWYLARHVESRRVL
ncbi:MAG TPA: C40 family peptidase [Gemmatimonadales bacterium]|jgi:cell wall-associated NlpC family hydrolase|nr:C40 family peptidase [Gemmatimonadales bacterium]